MLSTARASLWVAVATLGPTVAVAAGATQTVVPVGTGITLGTVGANVSAGASLLNYLGAAYKLGVVAVAALAVLVIARGAIEVMSESFAKKTNGRERIRNAVLGLLLALGSVVILQTISKSFVAGDPLGSLRNLGSTVSQQVGSAGGLSVTGSSPQTTQTTNRQSNTPTAAAPWEGDGTYAVPGGLSDAEYDSYVRSMFGNNGISVNKGYAAGSSSNTNLNGLEEVAIQGLITMRSQSGANSITVTGGTEPGHAGGTYSHGNGYKIDVRPGNAAFDSYITNTFTNTGGNSLGSTYSRNYGTYTVNVIRESDHWDLQFRPN
jgi:hypothetical protein